jgi:glycerate 2-kinase
MITLQNRTEMMECGNQVLREAACEIIEGALQAVDPYPIALDLLQREDDVLQIGDYVFDLTEFEHIYLIGAGKATGRLAEAVETRLGDYISGGVLVLKQGASTQVRQVDVFYGAHPIPNEIGLRGAQSMMALARTCTHHDLVIACITGGSSSLLPLPPEGISFSDKQRVHEMLLACGADIVDINMVRKHLSAIKGGMLARAILPATLVNLTVSDVVGDQLDCITGPTVPDTSTIADAIQVLDRYKIWDKLPKSVRRYLRAEDPSLETPKSFEGASLHTYVVVDSRAACRAAAERAQALGFSPLILSSMLKGEARETGLLFAAIAREVVNFGHPLPKPCAIIAAGENTVTIREQAGRGGPNQLFALAASLDISGLEDVLIASIDTDGTDGPTDIAGALVDGSTVDRAKERGFNVLDSIRDLDVSDLLTSIGDAVITGHTGTNVNDLKFILAQSTS